MKTYVQLADVARAAGVIATQVRWWKDKGLLKPVARTTRGIWLFDPETVKRFLAKRKREDQA